MANDLLEKSFSTLTNGTEELQKLPGYSYYWQADHFGMYNAYGLKEGPSRELLAIHTPIGIIEPTRVVFGEKNAGQSATAPVRAAITSLPDNALARTACYVDDNAQGSHTFDSMLKGWSDFLKLCQDRSWYLNATKTKVGYNKCEFFGFEADAQGTRLADKNVDPSKGWYDQRTYMNFDTH